MRTLGRIIVKNLKLLVRSRSSALIIILAPLLIILLLGVAFDNANMFGLTVGVYSESYGANGEELLKRMSERDLRVIRYETEESCIEDIKNGVLNTCIVFPPNLSFESNVQQQITFHVDYSKINLVWMIMDTLNVQFGTSSKEISKDLVGVLVSKVQGSQQKLEEQHGAIKQLKINTEDTKTRIEGISGEITNLNFAVDNNTLATATLDKELASIEQNLSNLIDQVRSQISSAKDATNESKVITKLETASEKLDGLEEVVEGATPPSIIKFKEAFTGLKSSIESVKATLNQGNVIRESAAPKLSNAQLQLDQSVANIKAIEGAFDTIISEVNSIKVTDPNAIAQPIITEIKPVTAKSTYLNYLFPSLIMLVVMFIAMLLSTTLVMMEKHSPAYFRNFIAPTRNITFVLGTYLTNMLLVTLQVAIILGIAGYFFSAQVLSSNLPLIAGILLLAATFFTLWGMAVGHFFTSEETATLATVSSGSIFLFISSVIIPIESMPALVRQVASFNPFVICERLLRQALLLQPRIEVMQNDLITMGIYSVVLFLGILVTQNIMNRHYFQRLMYHHHKKKRTGVLKPEQPKVEPKAKASVKSVPITTMPSTGASEKKSLGWGFSMKRK